MLDVGFVIYLVTLVAFAALAAFTNSTEPQMAKVYRVVLAVVLCGFALFVMAVTDFLLTGQRVAWWFIFFSTLIYWAAYFSLARIIKSRKSSRAKTLPAPNGES